MSEDEVSEIEDLTDSEGLNDERRVRRKRGHIEVLRSGTVRLRLRGTWPDGTKIDESYPFAQGSLVERKAAARAALPSLWRDIEEKESGQQKRELALTLAEAVDLLKKKRIKEVRKSDFDNYLVRVWRGVDVRQFTDVRWSAWVDRMRREGYAAATIRHAYSTVSAIITRCVAMGWIRERPWRDVSRWLPAEKETHTRAALETHEMEALIAAADKLDRAGQTLGLALRVRVQYHCFCRPVELARMGPIHLVDVGDVPHLRWQAAKKGKVREYPLSDDLADELREWWAALPALAKKTGVFFPVRGPMGKWKARVRKQGGYETGVAWTDRETELLRSHSGVAHVTPYFIRHSGATDTTVEHHLGAAEIMALIGHEVMRTTNRYVKGRIDRDKVAMLAREKGASRPKSTPEPTRTLVVHSGGSSAGRKPAVVSGTSATSANEVRHGARMTRADHRAGLTVDAEGVERFLSALSVVRAEVRGAGTVLAWLRVTTLDQATLLEVADDFEIYASAAAAVLPEPGDRTLVTQLVSAIRGRAHRPKTLAPVPGVDSAKKAKGNGHLRMVAGVSFTSSDGERSDE